VELVSGAVVADVVEFVIKDILLRRRDAFSQMDASLRSACRQIDRDYFPGFVRSPFVYEKSAGEV